MDPEDYYGNSKEPTIEKVVEQILIGQNVSYTVQGKDIITKKKSNQATQQKKKYNQRNHHRQLRGTDHRCQYQRKKWYWEMGLSPILTESFSSLLTKVRQRTKYLTWDCLTQEVNTRNKSASGYLNEKEDAQALDELSL